MLTAPVAAPILHVGIHLNTLDSPPRGPALIPLAALPRHLCILGTTGSGKTTTSIIICKELNRLNVPVAILDRTGEYAEALEAEHARTLNPGADLTIAPFRLSADGHLSSQIEDWVSLMDDFFHVSYSAGLSPLQARVLREVTREYYHGTKVVLTISKLISKLDHYKEGVKDVGGWLESIEALISRLYPLTVDLVGETLDRSYEKFEVKKFFEPGISVVDLSPLPDDRSRNIISQIILKHVYEATRRQGRTTKLRLVMLIDEAHYLAPGDYYVSIPERCAVELRKYGFSLITCATRPSLISQNIIANSNTIICHSLTSSRDIDLALNYMVNRLEADRFMGELRVLDVGEAFLQLNDKDHATPLRCKIGLPEHGSLLEKRVRSIQETALHEKPIPSLNDLLPDMDDSSWLVYDRLPKWATKAATLAYRDRGVVLLSKLHENGYNQRQVKDMIHGPHPIFEEKGPALCLSGLGEKVALIALTDGTR